MNLVIVGDCRYALTNATEEECVEDPDVAYHVATYKNWLTTESKKSEVMRAGNVAKAPPPDL